MGGESSPRTCLVSVAILVAASFGGCTERLNRENVFANTETGIGLFVAQNPKTQVYELKLGYLRHEFFFVPTSKTVTYNRQTSPSGMLQWVFGPPLIEEGVSNHSPKPTAEVLGEVAADVSADGQEAGPSANFGVRQRLAVGETAVRTGGAVALMADSAEEASASHGPELGAEVEGKKTRLVYDAIADAVGRLKDLEEDPQAQAHVKRLQRLIPRLATEERKSLDPKYRFEPATESESAVIKATELPEIPYEKFRALPVLLKHWKQSTENLAAAVEVLRAGATLRFQSKDEEQADTIKPSEVDQLHRHYEKQRAIFKEFDKAFRAHPDVIAAVEYFYEVVSTEGEENGESEVGQP